jgi:hypothetical protein
VIDDGQIDIFDLKIRRQWYDQQLDDGHHKNDGQQRLVAKDLLKFLYQ